MELEATLLPHRVFTVRESDLFRARLEQLHDAVYRADKGQDGQGLMKKYLLESEYEHILEYARSHGIPISDSQALQDYVTSIVEALSECEPLICKIAFRPRYGFVEKITQWFTEHISGYARITFVYTPDIIGGVVIEYRGKIYDYSIKRQLSDAGVLGYGNKAGV